MTPTRHQSQTAKTYMFHCTSYMQYHAGHQIVILACYSLPPDLPCQYIICPISPCTCAPPSQHVSLRLEEELEDVKQRQEERRGASGAGARSLEMDEADLQEYYRIKNEVGAKTAKLQADKQVLQQQQEAERLPLAELEDEAQQLEGQVGLLREQKDQLERSREQMSIEVETVRSTLERKRQDKSEMGEAARRQAARKEHLLHKVDELQEELHELKVTKKFSERERQRVDAVETMKGLIPGVYGSLNELSKVTHRKYNMAMAVTMGKHMDCVLVNTKDTAKECIRHLKEHRIPPMTFLPLDNLNLKPLNESLRQLGGTAKLAIDLLQFEPAYQRGLLYACGNTVVCDTVEEAKRLAFGGEERLKVVTLDGTLIDRSGMITGGTHGGMEARAAIFDQHKVETMKQERDRYKEELRHMPSDREAHQQEQQLSGEVVRLAEKQKYTEAEIAASGKKIISRDKEIEQLTERHEGLLPRMEQLRENVSDRQKEIDRIQVRIDAVTDRLFSSFSKRMGVKSIREYEENQVKRAEERAQEDMRLATDIAKIENQLKYERSRHQEQDKVERLRSELKTAREGLRDLKERQAAAEASCKEVEDRLAKERRLAGEAKEAADAFNGEIRDMRKKLAKISGEAAKVKRSVDAKKSSIEQIESRREEAVQAAKVEMGADFAVDFDTLSHQHRATRSVAQREKMEREFRSQIDDLGGRLAKAAPNLKALEQYELIKEQEREQAVALDAARQEAREAKEAFYAVHQRRYDAFMASYDHVKAAIEDIYRDLTKSELHPFGGMAYLNLENSDEPFNHGIRYHAMPPTKRFRDMEQLSGGEKTVAALALLFAIHSFRPSPFFVLDEIDASLDATNVARVAKYIYHATRPSVQGSFQAIVISLKDVFFSNSDMLVGVARDFGEGCGRTFTYDLSAHGPPE
ncbi:unnamed protein product [Ostreobium quekettii]|uniref:SMC hinge domain-containing protein n=1 Tax=Ostreobium quekettii TaxID=121088 RepID=A0A8S1ILM8_9CHLO|nr:unnamed protein product [Ostreobium quekettii]|eukprot:evm.model.scf_51.7 EVM.evm.TU.scf_51.7   scf_51:58237-65713(-)